VEREDHQANSSTIPRLYLISASVQRLQLQIRGESGQVRLSDVESAGTEISGELEEVLVESGSDGLFSSF
jgi:hypothetical protein